MELQGASIIAGSGAVVRHERLTVVVGGSVIQGSDELGKSTLRMLDALSAQGDWSFEAVAAALHQLVLAEDPRGVAAVLADSDGEVLLFAFDRATAQGGEAVATGDGRSGWKTEVATGPIIQLRLDNVPFKAAEPDILLRAGLVPGAGAILTMVPMPRPAGAPAVATATATPVSSAALPPNYLPAPPPTETNKVDSSLLPPPPGEWGRDYQRAPRRRAEPGGPSQFRPPAPSHNPPPPAGEPVPNLAPPDDAELGSQERHRPDGPPAMQG